MSMSNRWRVLLCLSALSCAPAVLAREAPQPKAVITIRPTDNPMQMAALKPLLKSDPGRLSGEKAWLLTDGDTVRLVVLNTSGKPVTAGAVTTDAEAAMLTVVTGKPSHLSAWHATRASVAGKVLLQSDKAVDVDRDL